MNKKCFFCAKTTNGSFIFWMLEKNCTFDGRISSLNVRKRALERLREKMINDELPTGTQFLTVELVGSVKTKPTKKPLSPEEKFQKQIKKYGDTPPYWQ